MLYSFIPLDSIDYKKYVIISDCLLFGIVSYLNYRQYCGYLIRDRPNKWIDVVTDEEFKKTQSYNLDKSRLTFIQDLVKQVWNVVYWHYDGLARLWDISGYLLELCGGGGSEHQIFQALIYNILFSWSSRMVSLPFSMYTVFILDIKHGFDKKTLGGFFYDIYMSEKMVLELITPILAASLWICLLAIRYSGENFFVYISLLPLILNVSSTIGPIFTELKLLEDDDLECSIRTLATRVGFPLKNIYVVDGRKALIDHSKAYIYGYGKNQHIVLYDILMDDLDTDEICAILAHEMGHWKMGVTIKKLGLHQLDTFVACWLLSFIINNDKVHHAFGFHSTPIYIGYTLFQSLFAPFNNFINFLSSAHVRSFEYKADAFALDLGYASKLRSALIKSSVTLIDGSPDRCNLDSWYSTYHNACPTLTERLDRLDIKPTSNKPVAVPKQGSKKDV